MIMNTLKTCLAIVFTFVFLHILAQGKDSKMSLFRDSTDKRFDISNWLGNKKGFLLVPTIITEPAVGYGAAAAVVFFHSSMYEKKRPPSMTGILGGGTENGTWLAGIFHAGFWFGDRVRYTGAIARTYANLGFYGSGGLGLLETPINLNLDAWILFQQMKGRIGKSDFFIGGKYILLQTDNTFETAIDIPEFTGYEFSSTLSEASLILNYDSRDNIFTPTSGYFIDVSGTYSDTWMGGDALYGRVGVDLIGYFKSGGKVNLGVRSETNFTMGDVPFYARPFVMLRGAPWMKYQDKNTTLIEAEFSIDIAKRWSIIGFTGLGTAFSEYSEFEKGKNVQTIGSGFRYFIARKFGAKLGMDFGMSQDDHGIYIVFGSSWLK
jgi:hypothetical protein